MCQSMPAAPEAVAAPERQCVCATPACRFMHRGSLFKLLRKGGNRPLDPKLQRSGTGGLLQLSCQAVLCLVDSLLGCCCSRRWLPALPCPASPRHPNQACMCPPPLPHPSVAVAISVARGMAYVHGRQSPLLHLDLKSPK